MRPKSFYIGTIFGCFFFFLLTAGAFRLIFGTIDFFAHHSDSSESTKTSDLTKCFKSFSFKINFPTSVSFIFFGENSKGNLFKISSSDVNLKLITDLNMGYNSLFFNSIKLIDLKNNLYHSFVFKYLSFNKFNVSINDIHVQILSKTNFLNNQNIELFFGNEHWKGHVCNVQILPVESTITKIPVTSTTKIPIESTTTKMPVKATTEIVPIVEESTTKIESTTTKMPVKATTEIVPIIEESTTKIESTTTKMPVKATTEIVPIKSTIIYKI
jgi:hypothetical protein